MSLESDIARLQTQLEQVIPALEKSEKRMEKMEERIRELERQVDRASGVAKFLRVLLPAGTGAGILKVVELLAERLGG